MIVVQCQMSNISGIDHGDQTPLVAMIEVSLLQKWLYLMNSWLWQWKLKKEKKNDTEPQLNLRCKNNISLSEPYTFGVLF